MTAFITKHCCAKFERIMSTPLSIMQTLKRELEKVCSTVMCGFICTCSMSLSYKSVLWFACVVQRYTKTIYPEERRIKEEINMNKSNPKASTHK